MPEGEAVVPEGQATVTGMMTALAGLGAILTAVTLAWVISVKRRDASIADICWGLGFVLLAWLYSFWSAALTPRSWLVAVLITLWGTRLSQHIFRRNRGKGEDPRYQAMRVSQGPAFWWRSTRLMTEASTVTAGL